MDLTDKFLSILGRINMYSKVEPRLRIISYISLFLMRKSLSQR